MQHSCVLPEVLTDMPAAVWDVNFYVHLINCRYLLRSKHTNYDKDSIYRKATNTE